MSNSVKHRNRFVYLPLAFALVLASGIYIGAALQGNDELMHIDEQRTKTNMSSSQKLNAVFNYIHNEYVDSVDENKLTDYTIQALLQELDPHSYYITAKEYEAMNEPLMGNFDGIGIEFSIQRDTIVVLAAISGGPSEMLGIKAGDRIIYVDSELVAGVGITNKDVMDKLRGERGTHVSVKIKRNHLDRLLDFDITRDEIPIYSVDASYMLSSDCGYIKISRFSKKTASEFRTAGEKLLRSGVKKLILDLRGNGGGFLDAAVQVADEFLSAGKLIVYTKGRARPKEIYKSTPGGIFENTDLSILVDEGSASASEIVSGAIQDNDRGIIIGRRTFGKGLVQEQTPLWPDGSSLRLTVARYYTPTGRCIQKPYTKGSKSYYAEYYKHLSNGDFVTIDSLHIPDSLKFKTPNGKTVYGGGGIMPDYIIPYDTVHRTYYFAELIYKGILQQFAFDYADKHRSQLNRFQPFGKFRSTFSIGQDVFHALIEYAESKGVKKNEKEIKASAELIKNRLKAYIARNIWQNEGFYPILNSFDPFVSSALQVMEKHQGKL